MAGPPPTGKVHPRRGLLLVIATCLDRLDGRVQPVFSFQDDTTRKTKRALGMKTERPRDAAQLQAAPRGNESRESEFREGEKFICFVEAA
jgi:hypothetical protein